MSEKALRMLRQKGLALDAYVESVQQMQDVVDGIFQQPSEYMAMTWRIERNAYADVLSLDTFLSMCKKEQKTNIGQETKDFII